MKNYRVGFGFDVHRFSREKKPLLLGAVKIPCAYSLKAVSDGDVLLHAIADALCGACLLGDIGDYFPPSKKYEGIDSKEIIKFILRTIGKKTRIINLDVIIVAEKPKLAAYKKNITESLKSIFHIQNINVKIKSKEGLHILGGKDAISCFALAYVEARG